MQITGLGALVVTPIVGNLSDRYGRKALMTLPVTVAILPLCTFSVWLPLVVMVRFVCSVRIEIFDLLSSFCFGSYTGLQALGGVLLCVLRR
jgi:MFS family permease